MLNQLTEKEYDIDIIKTDGTRHDVVPRNNTDFQCDELQEIIGGYFEILPLSKSQIMVVNEEGKIHGKLFQNISRTCLITKKRNVPFPPLAEPRSIHGVKS